MSRVGLIGIVGVVLLGVASKVGAQTPPADEPGTTQAADAQTASAPTSGNAATPASAGQQMAPTAATQATAPPATTAASQVGTGPATGAAAATPADPGGLSGPATGKTITEAWAIRTMLEGSLTLRASVLGIEQSREAVREQEGQFPYTFQADAGYTNSRTPGLGANDRVSVRKSNSLVVGSQLSKTFETGTTASLRVEGQRYDSETVQTSTTMTGNAAGGPGYQASVRAAVSQPLIAGYGREVNEAGLRSARISQSRLQQAYVNQQSEAVRDALQAYWDLWYTGRSIEIQKSALDLAMLQQREADQRVKHGALSAADALKFQSQVATLTESYLTAQADERSQALTLGQLVGIPEDSMDWHAANEEPAAAETRGPKELLRRALERSPTLASLRESLRLAVERRRTAGEQYRATLDLDAWAEAAGVGSDRVWPAVRQVGRFEAVSVYGGITYRTTLDSQRYSAARAQADYDVRIAESNIKIANQQIENGVAQLVLQVEQARVSAAAAERTLVIADQQAKNERQRFALGASTPLDVQVAEDALRQAQLRVVRAKLARKKTEIALAHMTGDLVDQYLPSP